MRFELSAYPACKCWRIHGSLLQKTWSKTVFTWQAHNICVSITIYGISIRLLYPILSYAGKDAILQEHENERLSLGATLVSNLVHKLPV